MRFVLPSLIIAGIYIILVTYLMNWKLVIDTIIGSFSLQYKADLLLALLGGMWTIMTGVGLITLFVIAILTGVNLSLLASRILSLKSAGKLHLTVGGSTLFGIVGSGCAACGLPVLALLGLTGSIVYLPFRGSELSAVAVLLLSMSLYFMIKTNNQMACNVNLRTSKT